jgi:hypothetical protein
MLTPRKAICLLAAGKPSPDLLARRLMVYEALGEDVVHVLYRAVMPHIAPLHRGIAGLILGVHTTSFP